MRSFAGKENEFTTVLVVTWRHILWHSNKNMCESLTEYISFFFCDCLINARTKNTAKDVSSNELFLFDVLTTNKTREFTKNFSPFPFLASHWSMAPPVHLPRQCSRHRGNHTPRMREDPRPQRPSQHTLRALLLRTGDAPAQEVLSAHGQRHHRSTSFLIDVALSCQR